MRRTALVILGSAGALVLLLLIGVAIVVATIDPSRFVAPLAGRIKSETGRTLKVQGPVEMRVSLTPKIVLPQVAFENAPGSKAPDMLTAKRVEAQIALLPLLSRRFEVLEFRLVEPVITLETDASGKGNWEFAAPGSAATGAQTPSGAAMALGIGNFEIRQGTLTYRNGASGKTTHAVIEHLTLRARDMKSPVAVDFLGSIDDVPVALAGDLGPPDQWIAQQWPYPVAVKGEVDGAPVKLTTKIVKAGTTTTLDELAFSYGSITGTGRVRSTLEGARTRVAMALDIPSLSLADLPTFKTRGTPASASPTPPAASAPAGHWIVPDTPLPLGVLAAFDGEGSLTIGELKLRNGQQVSRVTAEFSSADAQADIKVSAGALLGGSLRAELHVDGRRADAPAVRLQANAQELDLPKLAAAGGIAREIRGGKVRATIDVTGRGTTPHRVASTMDGSILVVSGPATLGRTTTQEQSAVAQIAGALDPFRGVDAATELRCAVFRLPVNNGVARVDRSIAVETGKVAGSASGTLDFRDETLDLSVQLQTREGIQVDLAQFAHLVRIRGRFDKPSVAIDAEKSAQMIAKLGALGAKGGGLEALGRALIAPATETSAPCALALSGKAPREAVPAQRAQAVPDIGLPQDLGKALGKLLGR
jgi:uncharacterized protein involved in outer membrane biogenesis